MSLRPLKAYLLTWNIMMKMPISTLLPSPQIAHSIFGIHQFLAVTDEPPTTALDCEEEFDYIRDRITSMSGSSFEVVNNASNDKSKNAPAKPDEIFSVHFSEINNLPSDFWLNKSMLKSQIKPANPLTPKGSSYATRAPLPELSKLIKEIKLDSSEEEPLKAAKNNRKRTLEEVQQSSGFNFEKVIRCIQLSEDEHWLLNKGCSSKQSSPPLLHSSCSAENMDEAEKVCGVQIDTKSEGDFRGLNKKKRFWQPVGGDITATTIATKSSNQETHLASENSEELDTWKNVLGWKRTLEKVHASREEEWLAPSSRKLAAKQTNA
uniref:Uncharacterized protein n=1 Tax=Ditylenchus dipsaci TaxID=166011 RepID=A0A915DHB0_9BILA